MSASGVKPEPTGGEEEEEIEESKRCDRVWRNNVWWHELDKTGLAQARMSQLLGVFCRRTLNLEMSAPCPLPKTNPAIYSSAQVLVKVVANGNRKEAEKIPTHALRPLGFKLKLILGVPLSKERKDFVTEAVAAEVADWKIEGPRPPFEAGIWFSALEGYRRRKTTIGTHWKNVLAGEWCRERPDLSFIFGTTRNPVTPFLLLKEQKGDAVADQIYREHMTEGAAMTYIRYVVLQFWLAVHGRWGQESVVRTDAFMPIDIFALAVNDFSVDEKASPDTKMMLERDPYHDSEFDRDGLRQDVLKALGAKAENDERFKVIENAFQFAAQAKRLTFGRFFMLVLKRLTRKPDDGVELASQATIKRNVANWMGSAHFVMGEVENLLEAHIEVLKRASFIEVKMPKKMHAKGAAAEGRTISDTGNLKAGAISTIEYEYKPMIPAVTSRLIKTTTAKQSEPPYFFTHLKFNPLEPVCFFKQFPKTTDASTEAYNTSRRFNIFYWTLNSYMNKEEITSLDKFIRNNGLLPRHASTGHANSKSIFANRANEDAAVRIGGARMRYAIVASKNGLDDTYATPDHVQLRLIADRTVPTKFGTPAQKKKKNKKQQQQQTAAAAAAPTIQTLLPESDYKSIYDPLMQSEYVTKHRTRLMMETMTAAKQRRMDRCAEQLAHMMYEEKNQLNDDKKGPLILPYVFLDLASRFSEIETWNILYASQFRLQQKMTTAKKTAAAAAAAALSYGDITKHLENWWNLGVDFLRRTVRNAYERYCVNLNPHRTQAQDDANIDNGVIHAVRLAFQRDRVTYSAKHTTIVNRQFDTQFFTTERVMRLLADCGFEIRFRGKAKALPPQLVAQMVRETVTAIQGDASIGTVVEGEYMKQLTREGAFQSYCSKSPHNNVINGDHYTGLGIIRHICDIWVQHVKHPIFFWAAYITNPPQGACLSTGSEWVPMNNETQKSSAEMRGAIGDADDGDDDDDDDDDDKKKEADGEGKVKTKKEKEEEEEQQQQPNKSGSKRKRDDPDRKLVRHKEKLSEGHKFVELARRFARTCESQLKVKNLLRLKLHDPRIVVKEGEQRTTVNLAAFFVIAGSTVAVKKAHQHDFELLIRQHEQSVLEALIEVRGFRPVKLMRTSEDEEKKRRDEATIEIENEIAANVSMDTIPSTESIGRMAIRCVFTKDGWSKATTEQKVAAFEFVARRFPKRYLGQILEKYAVRPAPLWWSTMNRVFREEEKEGPEEEEKAKKTAAAAH